MSLPRPARPALRRVPTRTIGAVSASVIALPLGAAAAQAASVPVPQPSRSLPSALDVAPPYQGGFRCLSENQPGPVAFAKLLEQTYGKHAYGILRGCDQEHGEGRALDWMLDARKADELEVGNTLTRWLSAKDSQGRPGAMARRFGINYMIWNRKIWKAWAPDKGWAAYSGSSPHTDHIHISFTWDGAYALNSWWTGRARTDYLTGPMKTGGTESLDRYVSTTLRRGSTGAAVRALQGAIGGLSVDGSFGPATEARVKTYQGSKGLPRTGVADRAVWDALRGASSGSSGSGSGSGSGSASGSSGSASAADIDRYASTTLRRGARGEAVRVLQRAVGGIAVDGSFGPATEARVKSYQGSKGLPRTGVVDRAVWDALAGRSSGGSGASSSAHPLAKYSGVTLRLWSRGEAVKALQKAVGGLAVDGSFGPRTQSRVVAWQKSVGLAADGVVDAKDWKALMAGGSGGGASSGASSASSGSAGSVGSGTGSSTSSYASTTLRRGSAGAAVRAFQQAAGGLTVDGRFGPRTETRVESIQRANGLRVTGVVDARTWTVVLARSAPLSAHYDTVLKRGARGETVRVLQRALGITADGSFGPQTQAAVKAAQKRARIAQTGVVARVTWKAIERQM
ncbi:peptidoglycan-binding domain-containing protein [Phycicoccus avicenniae]|uniref:peptidoglycan-binding domain-containing protein n=1 Tax=Phycicoccus avicenniae TaxID=2828860 RepID=UPI0020114213|nr:peptidoglycan-binding protein [Phycicoccus avicenniae]